MVLDDPLHDREADPDPVGARREEGVEELLARRGGDSRTVVLDLDVNARGDAKDADHDRRPRAARLHRVANQVPQDLTELRRIGVDRDGRGGDFADDADVAPAAGARRELRHLRGERGDVDRRALRPPRLREIEHVGDEIVQPRGLARDDRAEHFVLFAERGAGREEVDAPRDRSERVPDLVREPRGEATEHREPLCLLRARGCADELSAGAPQPLGEVAREERDDDEREEGDREMVGDVSKRHRVHAELIARRRQAPGREPEAEPDDEERRRHARDEDPADARDDGADDAGEAVERHRRARDAAGHVGDDRPRDLVEDELREGERHEPPPHPQQSGKDGGEGEPDPDRREDDLRRERERDLSLAEVEEPDDGEERRKEGQTERGQPGEPPGEERVVGDQSDLMFPARSKIGRYIETMTTPTIPPMSTIMIGSSMLVSAATATSTSSS